MYDTNHDPVLGMILDTLNRMQQDMRDVRVAQTSLAERMARIEEQVHHLSVDVEQLEESVSNLKATVGELRDNGPFNPKVAATISAIVSIIFAVAARFFPGLPGKEG